MRSTSGISRLLRRPIHNPVLLGIWLVVAACTGAGAPTAVERSPDAGKVLLLNGMAAYHRGCLEQAQDALHRAHEAYTVTDQLAGAAMSLNNLGNVYRLGGEPELAVLYYTEAFSLYRSLSDNAGAALALANKAAALMDSGRFSDAEPVLKQAGRFAPATGPSAAAVLKVRGLLALEREQYEAAERFLEGARRETPGTDAFQMAAMHAALGRLMIATGRDTEALAAYEAALAADRRAGFARGIADDLNRIGDILQRQGNHAAAADHFKRAVMICALLGQHQRVEAVAGKLAISAEAAGTDLRLTQQFIERWIETGPARSYCR